VKLTPDSSIRFDLKEMLIESEAELNEDLLLYLDNEMPAELRPEFEEALDLDPEMLNELILFSKTKLDPKEPLIEFPHKQSLYRTEERRRVIPIFWQRLAAVAAVLATIIITTVSIYNNRTADGAGQLAKGDGVKAPVVNDSSANRDNVAKETISPVDPQVKEELKGQVKDQVTEQVKEQANTGVAVNDKKSAIQRSANQSQVKETKVSPVQFAQNNNPTIQQPSKNDNVIASTTKEDVDANKNKNQQLPVTQQNNDALQSVASVSPPFISDAPSANDDNVDADQSSRKNKHRGFFRKVTRTFEKNTNIKATDDDRLLVGGLAIRL